MKNEIDQILNSFQDEIENTGATNYVIQVRGETSRDIHIVSDLDCEHLFAFNFYNLLVQLQFIDRKKHMDEVKRDVVPVPLLKSLSRSVRYLKEILDAAKEDHILDFDTIEYDFSEFRLQPESIVEKPNLPEALAIRDIVKKYRRILQNNDHVGDFIIFTNLNDEVFELECSEFTEDHHLLSEDAIINDNIGDIVTTLLIHFCKQYSIDPYELLTYMESRKDDFSHNALIAQSSSKKSDVVLYKNSTEGRVDFARSINDYLIDDSIVSEILSDLKAEPDFIAFCAKTRNTEYHLHTVCSADEMLTTLTDLYSTNEPIVSPSFEQGWISSYMKELYKAQSWVKLDPHYIKHFVFPDKFNADSFMDTLFEFAPIKEVENYAIWEVFNGEGIFTNGAEEPDESLELLKKRDITRSLFGGISLCYKNDKEKFWDSQRILYEINKKMDQ